MSISKRRERAGRAATDRGGPALLVAAIAILAALVQTPVPERSVASSAAAWEALHPPELPLDDGSPRATNVVQTVGIAWTGGSHRVGGTREASRPSHLILRTLRAHLPSAGRAGPVRDTRRITPYRPNAPPTVPT